MERTPGLNIAVRVIQAHVAELSLSDDNFRDDVLVNEIAEFSKAVYSLGLTLRGREAWLIDWLSAEHAKGALLYGAAQVNWAKNKTRLQNQRPFDPQTRGSIMTRFNAWAQDLSAHIDEYEHSARTSQVVVPWQRQLTCRW